MANVHHSINYIEFTVIDLEKSKAFFSKAFDWQFNDYGPSYAGIKNENREAGGQITTEPFAFPGGFRFHFGDPSGNELAVWSETN